MFSGCGLKILSSALVHRLRVVMMEQHGLETQVGFHSERGTTDCLFAAFMGLKKRQEHGMETWAMAIDLVKAVDIFPREAQFAVLRRFGVPGNF